MARRKSRQELAGVLDWFKKKPREERGLTVPSEERPRPSMFAAFAPPQLPAERREESRLPATPREQQKRGWAMRLFEAFAPSAQPEPPPPTRLPAPAQEQGPSDWERVFGPPPQAEDPTPQEMIVPPPTVEEMLPVDIFQQPTSESAERRNYTFIRLPRLRVGEWATPTPAELGEHFKSIYDTERIFADVRAARSLRGWNQGVMEAGELGLPLSIPVTDIVQQNFFTDFAKFYNIPWTVMQRYLAGANTDAEVAAAQQQILKDVIDPMNQRVGEAFEMIKPADLPGWFWVGYNENQGGWLLYYLEAMLGPQRLPYRGEPRA